MTRKSLLGLWCFLFVAFITTFSLASYAGAPNLQSGSSVSPTPRITQAIDPRNYVTLHGNTRPEAANAVGYKGAASVAMPVEHMLGFFSAPPSRSRR